MTPDEKHIKRINKYLLSIESVYNDLIMEIALLVVKLKVESKLFRFKDYKRITNQVNEALLTYNKNLLSNISVASQYEWDAGQKKINDLLTENLARIKPKVPEIAYKEKLQSIAEQSQNKKAFEAFQERKKGKFTTSERVWNITKQAKDNLEFAIDDALSEGMSAQELARKIKHNLNNPDALFRRVRDKHGNLVLSKHAETFNPGQGVYRSAHKNALRLAANEINTAYREAEQIRIEQNNDVVGVKIHLSTNPNHCPTCIDLAGTYPKDFKWSSWHTQCRCFRTTILKSPEELIKEINENKDLPPISSKYYVKSTPENFDKWMSENLEKMENWKRKPSFVTENKKFVK